MRRAGAVSALAVVVCLLITPARSEETGRNFRVWTDTTGERSAEAALVEIKGDRAIVRRPNGQLAAIQIERLSDADRRFFAPLELDPWSAPASVHRSSPVATKLRDEDRDPPSGIKRSNRPPPMRSGVG